eukprot:Rhum_TRINITY_DN15047_c5_g4::Rhum_TRINITY_DN15047_c5_g4_i1::g.136057::m.136057
MRVLSAAILAALATGAVSRPTASSTTGYKRGDKIFKTSYGNWERPKQTVPYWTDKPIGQRAKAPYTPPAGWNYNTTGGPVDGMLNVHLVSHTHDDTGWQVTVDQYFYEEVYFIIDTVVTRLDEDPNRKFMYVETGFFARWWDQQPTKKKDLTKRLVAEGRLEFVNGGWCMHDEASPFYVEMIDQTTRGHQFLNANFGEHGRPKGTWSIDPFGHSNTNAWLLGAEAGMDYIFWGRSDYQDFAARKKTKGLEWIWEGSASLGASAQVFAGDLFGGGEQGYGTWFGFDGTSQQIRDDPERHDYNIDKYVDQFVQHARVQAGSYKTEHQMWACGSDFNYQNADHWFHNLDKLIHYINHENKTINIFYSTPTIYTASKLREKKAEEWEVRTDDMFPLADGDHKYWSGYFTSRPSLKRLVRRASNYLTGARQMEILSGVKKSEIVVPTTKASPLVGSSWTDSFEGSIGVTTHHDGMSGTERQSVANDYATRISESWGEVEEGVSLSMQKLMGLHANASISHCNCNKVGATDCLQNATFCSFTTQAQDGFHVAFWNPLARTVRTPVRLPVSGASYRTFTVVDAEGKTIPSQVANMDAESLLLPLLYVNEYNLTAKQISQKKVELSNKADSILIFEAETPAVGYALFDVRVSDEKKAAPAKVAAATSIENAQYKLTFDADGRTSRLLNKKSGVDASFVVSIMFYNSSRGGCTPAAGLSPGVNRCSNQASGAYMFRTNTSALFFPSDAVEHHGAGAPELTFTTSGGVVQEVHQRFSSWASLTYRLYANQSTLEVQHSVGPIPISSPFYSAGKELIVKYKTDLASDGVFYTDSNGRELIRRRRNKRGSSFPPLKVNEPIAGNYYPVNAMMTLEGNDTQLAVITDVTQGGSSIEDGELELMVHRRLQVDDNKGVQEPLNETMCGCNDIHAGEAQMGEHGHEGDGGCLCKGLTIRGTHLVILDTVARANELRRLASDQLSFATIPVFVDNKKTSMTGARTKTYVNEAALNPLVKLMTLASNYAEDNDGNILVRFSHLYAKGEGSHLEKPVTVNLSQVFDKPGLRVVKAEETQLTGMYAKKGDARWAGRDILDEETLTFTIYPMEVRTFMVTFKK